MCLVQGSWTYQEKIPNLRGQGGNAKGWAFVIGAQEAIQDPTVVTVHS